MNQEVSLICFSWNESKEKARAVSGNKMNLRFEALLSKYNEGNFGLLCVLEFICVIDEWSRQKSVTDWRAKSHGEMVRPNDYLSW
jgi:hypothetical protein